ncbi:DUF1648 domain-containing protein [Mycetocola tolaasinivorans]|uniref:DUF1648 domain-containing protein n=1 Tax=Mycetocola tolaasinivorans TaxID=76635 RepID=UPI0011C45D57|nr:DUF1648 domain-containing protein [Mycetocola tolaasinivorans]
MTSLEPEPRERPEPNGHSPAPVAESDSAGAQDPRRVAALARTARLLVIVPILAPGIIGSLLVLLWSGSLPDPLVTQWDFDGSASSFQPLVAVILFPLGFSALFTLVMAPTAFLVIRGKHEASTVATQVATGAGISAATTTLLLSTVVMQRGLEGQTWAGSVLPILIAGGIWIILAILATSRLRRLIPKLRAARASQRPQ